MRMPLPKSLLACLAILVVVMTWFSPWWAGGKVLAPLDLQNLMMSPWRAGNETDFAKNHMVSDGVDQYLVYRMVAAGGFAREGWIGWSSLTYGGTAQYANTMALYFDWTMQLHRWFDFWTAWHLGLLGQVLLAAYGMFLFLRGRGINCLWSACGAIAYAANSQFVTWIFHRWALGSFCWVPWILWGIDGYRRGRPVFWALVPLFIALAFMGGSLQHGAIVCLAVMAMWAEEALGCRSRFRRVAAARPSPDGKHGDSDGQARWQIRIFARYLAWGILGGLLAAMMLLPCIDSFIASNRLGLHRGMTVNLENSVYPEGWLQPLFNLAAYPLQVFPSLLGRCDSLDVMKLFKSDLFYVCYFGFLPVLAGYLGMFRKDTPLLARLLCAGGLLLPLTPLVRLLYQRLFLLFVIGAVLAFAHFMMHASRDRKRRWFRTISTLAGGAVAVWLAASAVFYWMPETQTRLHEMLSARAGGSTFGYFSEWISARTDRFIGGLFVWSPHQAIPLGLLVAGLAGLRVSASNVESTRRWGGTLVAIAITCEVTLFAFRWVVWSDPQKHPLFPDTPESRVLRHEVGKDGRVTILNHPTGHMAMTPFLLNTLSAYDVATISGYDSIVPDGMILPNESPGDAERLGRLAVTHLITWTGNREVPEAWQEIWHSPMMTLYENPMAMPRYMGFTGECKTNDFFAGFDVPYSPLEEKTGKENMRKISVPVGITHVRIAENHANGWKYRLGSTQDFRWKRVKRAPDASMLLDLPHTGREIVVEMRYDPPVRWAGMTLSLASLLMLAHGQWFVFRRGRLQANA